MSLKRRGTRVQRLS